MPLIMHVRCVLWCKTGASSLTFWNVEFDHKTTACARADFNGSVVGVDDLLHNQKPQPVALLSGAGITDHIVRRMSEGFKRLSGGAYAVVFNADNAITGIAGG